VRGVRAVEDSQENIEAFERELQAYNQQDIEAILEVLDPEVEWRPAVQKMLGGEATVYRGHEGIREMLRDLSETLTKSTSSFSEVRDQGDHVCRHRPPAHPWQGERGSDRSASRLRG
jgi:ketosteroid isomerase-like protein